MRGIAESGSRLTQKLDSARPRARPTRALSRLLIVLVAEPAAPAVAALFSQRQRRGCKAADRCQSHRKGTFHSCPDQLAWAAAPGLAGVRRHVRAPLRINGRAAGSSRTLRNRTDRWPLIAAAAAAGQRHVGVGAGVRVVRTCRGSPFGEPTAACSGSPGIAGRLAGMAALGPWPSARAAQVRGRHAAAPPPQRWLPRRQEALQAAAVNSSSCSSAGNSGSAASPRSSTTSRKGG
jgi:hypothetical protein